MKTIKLKLVANNLGKWKTLPDKINELKKWAKGIDLQIDLKYTTFDPVPFSIYNPLIDQYNKKLISTQCQGVSPDWYDTNISSQAKGYDIVLFCLNMDQWEGNSARGWRTDSSNGPIELQVGSDEREHSSSYNNFLMFAKHEISHALYMMTGQADRTHEFYYNGDEYCDKIWGDLRFVEPNWADDPVLWERFLNFLRVIFSIMKEEPKTILPDEPVPTKATIENFCKAIERHEGYFQGSRSFRNNNSGNLRYCEQRLAIGKDKQNFAIFATYQDGFNTLKEMITRAKNGLSKVYSPENTLTDFFSLYAPAFDSNDPNNYAKVVAKEIGVDTSFKIKNLIA
jgi:hypothetical protein